MRLDQYSQEQRLILNTERDEKTPRRKEQLSLCQCVGTFIGRGVVSVCQIGLIHGLEREDGPNLSALSHRSDSCAQVERMTAPRSTLLGQPPSEDARPK